MGTEMLQDPKIKDGLSELEDSHRALKEALEAKDVREMITAIKAIKVDADWLLGLIRDRLGTR